MSDEQWEEVGESNVIRTSKMKINESFTGKLLALEQVTNTKFPRRDKEGNLIPSYNLRFVDEEGDEFLVYPSGNLTYKIQDEEFEVGQTYRITRLENDTTKTGNSRTKFRVQRYRSDGSEAGPKTNTEKPSGKTV